MGYPTRPMTEPSTAKEQWGVSLVRQDTGEALPIRGPGRLVAAQARLLAQTGIPVLLTTPDEERLYLPELIHNTWPYKRRCPKCSQLTMCPISQVSCGDCRARKTVQ